MALMIVFVAAAGLLPLGIVAFSTSENQGHLSARTSSYARAAGTVDGALVRETQHRTRGVSALDLGGSGLTIGGSVILLPRSRCMWTTWISMER